MTRYFMHLRDDAQELLDPEGSEYPTRDALSDAVLRSVRDLIAGDVVRGHLDLPLRIDAHDDAGTIVHSLPFKDALNIIREGDTAASLLTA